MLCKRPNDRSYTEQGAILDHIASGLFPYLQKVIVGREQLNFKEMFGHLETWRTFPEQYSDQQFGRWHMMYRLLWCAEQAFSGSDPEYAGMDNIPAFIEQHRGWTRNCIRLLRDETTLARSAKIAVAMSDPLNRKGYIHTLVLEILEPGDGEAFHHPMDALATFPSRDFNESMLLAWDAARNLAKEKGIDIPCDGRWRLLDKHNRPVLEAVGGRSAGGSAARGWLLALQGKEPNHNTIVLADVDSDGMLTEVAGINEKMGAIIANGSFDTVAVAGHDNKQDAQHALDECHNTTIRVINTEPKTLKQLLESTETVISASIDNYYPNKPTRVKRGVSIKLSFTFTNTGGIVWPFVAGASVWRTDRTVVANYDKSFDAGIQCGEQVTVEWEHKVEQEECYYLQFAVWKNNDHTKLEHLVAKKPFPFQILIVPSWHVTEDSVKR